MNLLKISVYLSLIVQIFTGIFDYYVVRLNVPNKLLILQQVLLMELIVQIVEGIFYIWLALNISSLTNITPHRYYDWYLTTPTMLISLCVYLIYLKNKENNVEIKDDLFKIIYNNLNILIPILFLNFVMLTFGYLTEIKRLSQTYGVIFGFIPFLIYFYLIYTNFAKSSLQGYYIFNYFFVVWFIYGIAALMDYKTKNILYNILDLFAKNFFGLYLGFAILTSINE
jgi:bacteriorhodopsin